MKFKFDCSFVARALIALLFVVAALIKLGLGQPGASISQAFNATAASLPQVMTFLPASLATLALIIVLIIELPIALMYAYGYKYVKAGWVLIGFVVVVTIFYHNPWFGGQFNAMNLVMALKNLAIIGGILATIGCYCGKCRI